MRAAYQQSMQEKNKIQSKGPLKGFSNDGIADLMSLGHQGPLD